MNLRYYRRLNNLTQADMANKLGVRQSVYSRKESGVIAITLEEAKTISDVLGLPIEEIFFNKVNIKKNIINK